MVGCNNYEMLRDKCIIQADGFQSSPRIITADEWVKDGGTGLGAIGGNAVGIVAAATNKNVVRWAAAATTTDIIRFCWEVPEDFRPCSGRTGENSDIVLSVRARKIGTGGAVTEAVGTVNLACKCYWQNPAYNSAGVEIAGDATVQTHTTAISTSLNALAASVPADSNADAVRRYDIKLVSNMSAAQRLALKPGASFDITLYPSATVTANTAIEIWSASLIYRRHAIPLRAGASRVAF
jgi:hypothetical protein